MTARFLQIHTLTSYHASLLNRDDAGFAKSIPFGGVTRTRISSQCLKRHWRRHGMIAKTDEPDLRIKGTLAELAQGWRMASGGDAGEPVGLSVRSRKMFQPMLVEPLTAAGVEEGLAFRVGVKLVEAIASSPKTKDGKIDRVEQPLVLGRVELGGLVEFGKLAAMRPDVQAAWKELAQKAKVAEASPSAEAKEAASGAVEKAGKALDKILDDVIAGKADKKTKKGMDAAAASAEEAPSAGEGTSAAGLKAAIEALKRGSEGLDGAVFGRMLTSDIRARTDAAVHVAHAFTVHEQHADTDYFSVMDDLNPAEDKIESAHNNNADLNAGLYYGYVVIDVNLLKDNLAGLTDPAEAAAQVVERLIKTIATVTPGAKLGSTAPHAYADLVLIEAGDAQPRSLANAFLKPVPKSNDLQAAAYRALGKHLGELDGMYATGETRRFAAIGPVGDLGLDPTQRATKLADVAGWAADQIRG